MENLPVREYAHPLDRHIFVDGLNDEDSSSPLDPTRYGGDRWYRVFRDRQTGEYYKVECSDGPDGGKRELTPEDNLWVNHCFSAITQRTLREASEGVTEIELSTNEWYIMLGFTHFGWLDPKKGETYGEGDRSKDEGVIGYIRGIPVLVNPKRKDELPNR